VSVGKRDTHTIEGRNSELRHYLARLHRKTKCYSKSLDGSSQAVKLFVWDWNRCQRRCLAEPKLKGKPCLLYYPNPDNTKLQVLAFLYAATPLIQNNQGTEN